MPQEMLDQCQAQNIAISGNVAGKNSTTDLKGQPVGPFTQWHLIGWTPRAKGALAGCILAALVGIVTIVWYSMNALTEEEVHAAQQRKFDEKLASGGRLASAKRIFHRQN